MLKHKKIVTFSVIATIALISMAYFIREKQVSAQIGASEVQRDAIAVRVIPNPGNYSVARWYQSQGFSGSPQTLTVDGYEALRDGRTVYINAAHVDGKTIYTNIYLISYNQDYNIKTVDILGQIIANWKFNDNLPKETAVCSISSLKCEKDADCASNQSCNVVRGACALKEVKNCAVDTDCPANFFCDSVKSKIIRDLKRVGRIEEIREALTRYMNANGHYPLLESGTYLSGKSTSLWPSWNQVFLRALGLNQTITDPINRFGACPGYDAKTCWNKDKQEFVGVPATGSLSITLPNDSHALVYTTNQSGSQYNICAAMESRSPALGYTLFPSSVTENNNCVLDTGILATGNSLNNPPRITELALKGMAGREYNGFVRAVDLDGDPLTWSVSGGSWSGWSGMPIIRGTHDPNQKKLFAERAGGANLYPITVTVRDMRGGENSTTTNIEIISSFSLAEVNEYNYRLDPVLPLSYSFYISGGNSLPSYSLRAVSGPDVLRYGGISATTSPDGANRLKVSFQGVISTNIKLNADTETVYELTVNSAGATPVVSRFIVRIKVDRPILELNCATQSRRNHDYSCLLGKVKQGNHDIQYSSVLALPTGLIIAEKAEEPGMVYLLGKTTAVHEGQEVRIRAVNEYGTETIKNFILRVNTYCGDGILQSPNSEGRGGVFNNGHEACDGGNTTSDPLQSSKARQYACNTPLGTITPYPISGNSYCVFKSPLDGGGYCGDTYCQTKYENTTNCPFDCNPINPGANPNLGGSNVGVLSCLVTGICPDGKICVNGSCVDTGSGQCWDVLETTKSVLVEAGDATKPSVRYYYNIECAIWCDKDDRMFTSTELSGCGATQSEVRVCALNSVHSTSRCSVIRLDNPLCADLNLAACPSGCNSRIGPITPAPGKNYCRTTMTAATGGWVSRTQAMCYGDETVRRCLGQPCRTTLGSTLIDGVMNASGQCVKQAAAPSTPPPVCKLCDGQYCGPDGCGGNCPCDGGYTCSNNSCVFPTEYCPPCSGTLSCGTNECGSPCGSQGGNCPNNYRCIQNVCRYAVCGDGVKAEQEECDNGNQNTNTNPTPNRCGTYSYCNTSCRLVTVSKTCVCGNGIKEENEQCDFGVNNTNFPTACGVQTYCTKSCELKTIFNVCEYNY